MASGNFDSNTPGVPAITGKNAAPPSVPYIPASTNLGVIGESASGTGVVGISSFAGGDVDLAFPGGEGVVGINDQFYGTGVHGQALGILGTGVYGRADGVESIGVFGESNGDPAAGVSGLALTGAGVIGFSPYGAGIAGGSDTGAGLDCSSDNVAVYAHNNRAPGHNNAWLGAYGVAGEFHGDVLVLGSIRKSGGGYYIDHPLYPATKYFSHSFVESADMKNIYDGIAVLDAGGEAEIELPSWFDTVNTDFRYQLTCIGGYAPVYIAQEVQSNRFKIGGGAPGMKVSWLVTGIRQDAWAKAHPLLVEEEKPAAEQGYYLDPGLYGESDERHIRNVRYPDIIRLASRFPQRRSR